MSGWHEPLGWRLREACLADLKRIEKELQQNGCARILEGTKGGRKVDNRTVKSSPDTLSAVNYALSVKPDGSRNLLDTHESYKSYINHVIAPSRVLLKQVGITSFKELRARFAQELYQEITQQPLPLHSPPQNELLDHSARLSISLSLGHNRTSVSNSYVGGKR